MNNRWLNDLRRKMEDHEEDVPDRLWEDIRNELFNEDKADDIAGFVPADIKAQRKTSDAQVKPLVYRLAGIAAAIAVLIIIGKKLFDLAADQHTVQENISAKTISVSKSIERQKGMRPSGEYVNRNVAGSPGAVAETITDRTGLLSSNILIGEISGNGRLAGDIQTKVPRHEIKDEALNEEIPAMPKNNGAVADNSQPTEAENPDLFPEREVEPEEKIASPEKAKLASQRRKKTWMLGMLTGNASLGAAEKFPGYASLNGSTMSIDDQIWTAGYDDNPLMEVLLANQDKEVEARVKHKVPVTLGLSVYYGLGKRWGISTGINYTKLSTELYTGSASDFIKSDQSVHYVGIPVQVNYNVIKKGNFTGYVTGGALVEKAVAGSIKTKYIIDNKIKDEVKENLEAKPVQFSVNSAIGLQLKVINNLGIYAEPGIGYHFKDNSQLNTIYKDKPLNFNIKFGVRILID
ncbi:outer membrane beta-barrel protein [Chryseobacterium gossypii]|uniref:outer membrane beta-barrel protein n=1 Tax=Chryseobacterium gossypii TaxID=3231602 RepID=UPI003525C146